MWPASWRWSPDWKEQTHETFYIPIHGILGVVLDGAVLDGLADPTDFLEGVPTATLLGVVGLEVEGLVVDVLAGLEVAVGLVPLLGLVLVGVVLVGLVLAVAGLFVVGLVLIGVLSLVVLVVLAADPDVEPTGLAEPLFVLVSEVIVRFLGVLELEAAGEVLLLL